jgi:hypothetical protein
MNILLNQEVEEVLNYFNPYSHGNFELRVVLPYKSSNNFTINVNVPRVS